MGQDRIPSKSNTAAIAHAITEDLAGKDGISEEDGSEFLLRITVSHHVQEPVSCDTYNFRKGLG